MPMLSNLLKARRTREVGAMRLFCLFTEIVLSSGQQLDGACAYGQDRTILSKKKWHTP